MDGVESSVAVVKTRTEVVMAGRMVRKKTFYVNLTNVLTEKNHARLKVPVEASLLLEPGVGLLSCEAQTVRNK
jgi:hypothetical protein